MSRGDLHEALVEKAAKAINPYLGCCLDCPNADHAARAVLEAVADDIRAGALREAAERLELRQYAVAGQHHLYYSVSDCLLVCLCGFRSHVKRDLTEHILGALDIPGALHHRQWGTGRLHHNHMTRDIQPRGECPACDGYHAQREQR